MNDSPFNPEQQEYLKGFMAGVEARRGSILPAGEGTYRLPLALGISRDT